MAFSLVGAARILRLVIRASADYNKGVDTILSAILAKRRRFYAACYHRNCVRPRAGDARPCQGQYHPVKNIGRDITQGFKTLVGGELKSYTDMMNEARSIATQRMVDEAQALGADAVVAVRYSSASVMQGAAEVMAYGTAVKFK